MQMKRKRQDRVEVVDPDMDEWDLETLNRQRARKFRGTGMLAAIVGMIVLAVALPLVFLLNRNDNPLKIGNLSRVREQMQAASPAQPAVKMNYVI